MYVYVHVQVTSRRRTGRCWRIPPHGCLCPRSPGVPRPRPRPPVGGCPDGPWVMGHGHGSMGNGQGEKLVKMWEAAAAVSGVSNNSIRGKQ